MNYKITIISDQDSWINDYIPTLIHKLKDMGNRVDWVHKTTDIKEGDFCFMLSFSQIVSTRILKKNRHNLVVHESHLPRGRGWSPLTWQIVEGKNEIPITLFEADKKVDRGVIYLDDVMRFDGSELVDKLRATQAKKTIQLCVRFVKKYPEVVTKARKQRGKSSYYRKRTINDSRLDISKSIESQINLLRVVDNKRYPAFFIYQGKKYLLTITRD